MRSVHAYHMVKNRYTADSGGNKAPQCRGKGSLQMDGFGIMITGKAAAWAGGAAVAGGIARFLARGEYKTQLFVQDIVGAIFGWCLVVAISVLYPQIVSDPWIFASIAFISAYVSPAILQTVFRRIETVEVHVKAGVVEVHSDGKESYNERREETETTITGNARGR